MGLNYLFEQFDIVNDMLGNQLLEMSIKQHQITLSMKEPIFEFQYIQSLLSLYSKEECYVTTHTDTLYFTLVGLSTDVLSEDNMFYPFMDIIEEIAKEVCTCPSLEFVISSQYIKCFLDKPGLKVSDLSKYEEVFKANGQGELELHPQRPYLLFINVNKSFSEDSNTY